MANRSEAFGRLLKAGFSSIVNCEGKTAAIVEEELGQQIGVSGDTIQRYKAGYLPPEPRTIEILAEAAVRRGYLGREWLQRFLHAARYPFTDKLLDQLKPIGPSRPRPPRVYENLPAPTYSQFVMREQAFADVLEGLGKRSAAVLLVGLGGNGKTSLAREVAAQCLTGDAPHFDAVVWVSDKDRPGTTNLSVVLDEIARTLDYPGFTQYDHEEKAREVGQLLRRQRVLIIVDNFETITDGALLAWLLNLPEPSKALITSREKHRGLWSSWLAELRGMSEAEAQTLIQQRLCMLQLNKLVKNSVEFEPLITVTGGNPKAIEIALGLVKHERRPLQQMVDDLYAAQGELFNDLFTRAWALLDEAARRVLLVITFFPASVSDEALAATADVHGFAFDRAVERLTDLALLDVQQIDFHSVPTYVLHPLVRAFARAKLAEDLRFEELARVRWGQYFLEFANRHIVRENPTERYWNCLLTQDLEMIEEKENDFLAVLEWSCQHDSRLLIELMIRLAHYFRSVVRARIEYASKAAEAARLLGLKEDEAIFRIDSLGWILIEVGDLTRAYTEIKIGMKTARAITDKSTVDDLLALGYAFLSKLYLEQGKEKRSERLLKRAKTMNCRPVIQHRVKLAMGELSIKKSDFSEAVENYEEALRLSAQYGNERPTVEVDYSLGIAYLSLGNLSKAETAFRKVLGFSEHPNTLEEIYGKFGLAHLALVKGESVEAYKLAQEAQDTLPRLHPTHRLQQQIKLFLDVVSRLLSRCGNRPATQANLAEARAALGDLDTLAITQTTE